MGCLPSKDSSNVDKSPQAGYFAVSYTFQEMSRSDETQETEQETTVETKPGPTLSQKTRTSSAKEKLGRPLFGGGLASGFGQFDTMFSKRVNEDQVKEKPKQSVSRELDMTLVYQVPRSKLNINPHADDTKEYFVHDCRVTGLKDTDENTKQLLDYFRISPP